MSNSTKLFSTEWGGPSQGRNAEPSNVAEQGDKDTSVAAVLAGDEERQIQGADINGYIKGSLDDDASATEQGDEQAEEERVEKEARANQR